MIEITEYSGISINSEPIKVVTEFSGVSLVSEPIKVVTDFSGVSLTSEYTLKVRIFDSVTNQQISSSYQLVNNTNNNDVYTNLISSDVEDHFITVDFPSNLSFIFNTAGYIPKTETYVYNSGVECHDIYLDPIPFVSFSCNTFPVNAGGIPISKAITGSKIRVVFTGSDNFDPNDYIFSYEAFRVGSIKTSIQELQGEVVEVTPNSISIDFDPVDSNLSYCYIPNVTKKQCL